MTNLEKSWEYFWLQLANWLSYVVSTYLDGAFGYVCSYHVTYVFQSEFTLCVSSLLSVYELSGCGFESRCSHLNFRYRACFEQGIPWHLGNYRVWIPSEIHRRHNKNIQSIFLTFICLLDQTTKQPLSNLVAYKTKINVLWFHSKIFTSRTCKNKTTSFDVLIYFLKKAKYASWWLLDFLQIKVFQYLTVLIFSEILRAQIHYFNCITK